MDVYFRPVQKLTSKGFTCSPPLLKSKPKISSFYDCTWCNYLYFDL